MTRISEELIRDEVEFWPKAEACIRERGRLLRESFSVGQALCAIAYTRTLKSVQFLLDQRLERRLHRIIAHGSRLPSEPWSS